MILNLKNHPVWGERGKGMVGGQGEILPQSPMVFFGKWPHKNVFQVWQIVVRFQIFGF